jgi:glycosyltransferase involved in cell wall biosynthesis
MLDRSDLFPDNWIYIHTPGVMVGRIQNFNNWSRAMVPVPGMTCLGMEYFCFEGDGLWASPDADLVKRASTELEALGLARASDVKDGTVIRMPKAYPIYDSKYRDCLDGVRRFIDPIPNLHTVGRNGMHKYNNQDHSMLTAMFAGAEHEGGLARYLGGKHRLRVPRRAEAGAERGRNGPGRTVTACALGWTPPAGPTAGDTAASPGNYSRRWPNRPPNDEFQCFLDSAAFERFDLSGPNVHPVLVEQGRHRRWPQRRMAIVRLVTCCAFSRAVWRAHPDVFFFPSVYTYFPLPPGQRAVVTVHDAIAERFPELTLPTPRARLFWKLKVGLALRQSRLVLTVSDFAAREIAEVLHIAPERIRVAGEAPAPDFRPSDSSRDIQAAAFRAGMPPGARWFVYVGGFNPHKNVDAVVRAHAALVKEAAPAPRISCWWARSTRTSSMAIRRRFAAPSRKQGTDSLVHWTGFVPDSELRHLHSGAVALVLPSANEGYGLPAVEAAACGAPVIATTASPLPELLEGGGIFVRPGDEEALLAALRTMLCDEAARTAMARVARGRASQLSWDRGAATTLAALREAAA